MSDEIDITLKEERVSIKDQGKIRTFMVREFLPTAYEQYATQIEEFSKINGAPVKSLSCLFLSHTLFEILEDGSEKVISADELEKFPMRAIKLLLIRARKLSDLDEQAGERAKNV